MDWQKLDRLAATGPVPMQQHDHYGATCRAMGSRVDRYALGTPGAHRATAQVLLRRVPLVGDVALVSRGPTWAPDLYGSSVRIARKPPPV